MEDPTKDSSQNLPPYEKGRRSLIPLLDLEFKKFITPSILKSIYVLSIVMVIISTLSWVFSAQGVGNFIWRVISSPFLLVFGILCARVVTELVMTAFKLLETQQNIEKHLEDQKKN